VSITDGQFRLGVGVVGVVLVVGITAVRFCGSVSLPPKPPAPVIAPPTGTSREMLSRSAASPTVYQDFLASDAKSAGVVTPTIGEMSRKLPYRVDEARHVLEIGAPAIEAAGLRLRAIHDEGALVLQITNMTGTEVAYEVTSAPVPNSATCNSVAPLPFDAMTIPKGRTESRVECAWRDEMALAITRVETVEISSLMGWYLEHLPPSAVGIEQRIARGHSSEIKATCAIVQPQIVRSGLEKGEIGWRDLVDFYARHRCQTYQFPVSYRAFRTDSERIVPDPAAVN